MELASAGSEDLNSKMKALFDDPDDEAYWKEFCEAEDVHDGQREIKKEESKITDVNLCQHCDATYTKIRSLYVHTRRKHRQTTVLYQTKKNINIQ